MIWLEALSYLVTILGFPIAIIVFVIERNSSRENEESELHRQLSEEYDNFLRLVLDNADLLLLRAPSTPLTLTEEQLQRREIIYMMLVSLFEKAYIILYDDNMNKDARRRWMSWEDDMREWSKREDFVALLPKLLQGEDDAFSRHFLTLMQQPNEADASASTACVIPGYYRRGQGCERRDTGMSIQSVDRPCLPVPVCA